jgi:hypothetical protein
MMTCQSADSGTNSTLDLDRVSSLLRFDFDADLKTLTIRMPTFTHEEAVKNASRPFEHSMQLQRVACGRKLPWFLGTNSESCLEASDESRRIESKFIPDITIHHKYGSPLVIGEVDFTQARNNVLRKISERMVRIPSLLGAIVINIDESPVYGTPTRPASPNDYIDESIWDRVVESAPVFGPIEHGGHCWVGSIRCSVDIQFRDEATLRVKQAVRMFICIWCSSISSDRYRASSRNRILTNWMLC